MKSKIIILLIILFTSCKSTRTSQTQMSISSYYLKEVKNNSIKSDPIVVEDNKLTGQYSIIDLNLPKYKLIDFKSIQIIPKGITFLNVFFGENAENGIIKINRQHTLHCGGYNPKSIYLLDNRETTLEKLIKNKTKYYFLGKFEDLKDKNNEDVEITILSTLNPKKHSF